MNGWYNILEAKSTEPPRLTVVLRLHFLGERSDGKEYREYVVHYRNVAGDNFEGYYTPSFNDAYSELLRRCRLERVANDDIELTEKLVLLIKMQLVLGGEEED